jgi:hypothetical protein
LSQLEEGSVLQGLVSGHVTALKRGDGYVFAWPGGLQSLMYFFASEKKKWRKGKEQQL